MTTADNGSAANNAGDLMQAWQDMIRKSTEAWTQAAASMGGFTQPNPANPGASPFGAFPSAPFPFGAFPFGPPPGTGAPGSNPYSPPFNPADFLQTWQRMFESWQAQWSENQGAGSAPPSIAETQRQWSRYLESMASTFAETMSTEEFAKMLGKYMEQGLAWQERNAKQVNPQINAFLRMYNLPSRSQMDRLFARVIGIEEKLDDMEDELRKLRAEVGNLSRAQASRGRSSRAAAATAADQETKA